MISGFRNARSLGRVRVRVRVRVRGQSYIVNTSHGYFRKDNLDIWRNNMRKAKSTKRKASNAKSSNGYGSE